MKTIQLKHVYIESYGCTVGPLEAEGPLKGRFDEVSEDLYFHQSNFEKAECFFLEKAMEHAFSKGKLTEKDIELYVGGDLLNQLATSHYVIRNHKQSFIGVYAACATSCLSIANASMYIEHQCVPRAMAFCSSHNATAERQFRYPVEYGIQKPETTTFTVTGAGCVILTRKPQPIRVHAFTIGNSIDLDFTDVNDMGSAMTAAAFDTINRHMQEMKTTFEDYDLVVTGDLSKIGHAMLKEAFIQDQKKPDCLYDCGLMIYDIESQPVFCGGSGAACSMVVLIADLIPKLLNHTYKRVLLVATGALLSPVPIHQKESIPCIAHCIELIGEAL